MFRTTSVRLRVRRGRVLALNGIKELIQFHQEPRSVLGSHRRRPASAFAALAEVVQELSQRQRPADVVVVEWPSFWVKHPGLPVQAARGQGMSAVTTMSPAPACSTIQSSAASQPGHTTSSTRGSAGTRSGALATTLTTIL
jgi:hypothetical protein